MSPGQKIEGEHRLPFSVDAALLRELGERLVGRPYIALAELIKNAYDADATHVELTVEPDHLLVADDGHGMTEKAFRDRWMRVGSPHKEKERFSPKLKRAMTGSKGIGRLSAQFLGTELELWTQADAKRSSQLYADIKWLEARERSLITEAEATVGTVPAADRKTFAGGAHHGTTIRVEGLNQQWGEEELEGLAREVWALQPPFSSSKGGFEIKLKTADKEAAEVFESQAAAYLDVWYARIKGEIVRNPRGREGTLRAELEFYDGERHRLELDLDRCLVHHAEIEIRIYHLKYRQPRGLSVGDLRAYFNEWGGVHVYDAGFRLPYYGPDQDWLETEVDFSHRLATSKLLPASENVRNGLQYLPPNSRLFGEVKVSTNDELNRQRGGSTQDVLQIQASRDRLVGNRAFEDLAKGVRTTLDWYANKEAARVYRSREENTEAERVSTAAEELEDVAKSLEPVVPKKDFEALTGAVEKVREAGHAESTKREHETRLMATLASAGAASLAYEHEVSKQFRQLERIGRELKRRAKGNPDLRTLSDELQEWLKQAKRARGLFSPVMEEEKREAVRALPAADTVKHIVKDLDLILEAIEVKLDIDSALRLPKARYAEWNAIFQNAFSNAAAAMRETKSPTILVRGGSSGQNRYITIEDNGAGVDLTDADRLFEPFERGNPSEVGPGTGLGLPIVKLLADSIGVRVAFVEPAERMSTSLRISWRPTKS